MSDNNARSGLESNPSPDGFSAMPSDLSVNGAARGRGHAWTPGPWRVAGGYGGNAGYISSDSEGYVPINTPFVPGSPALVDKHGGATPEALANAHLIAAAPELYAALEKCNHGFASLFIGFNPADNDPDWQEAREAVEALRLALSRARGEKGGGA